MHDIEGAEVLDIFAGSCALGIDALSRGAIAAVFVETGKKQVEAIMRNLKSVGLEMPVMAMDYREAGRILAEREKKFDLIFADPPYEEITPQMVAETVIRYNLLSPDGLLIIEHKSGLTAEPENVRLLKRKKYGQTEVSFYAEKK